MEGGPLNPEIAQDLLSGIRKFVNVQTDDMNPAGNFFTMSLPISRQSLEVTSSFRLTRPEIQQEGTTHSICRKMHCFPVTRFKDPTERRPKDLPSQLIPLEIDHFKITGKSFVHDLTEIPHHPGVTQLQSHHHRSL